MIRDNRNPDLLHAFSFGLVLTFCQLLLCLIQTDSLLDLNRWDSNWYECIAQFGYQTALPPEPQNCGSNVAFFPAYPYLVRWLHLGTGMSIQVSLLVVAQVAAVLMWTYYFLLFKVLGVNTLLGIGMALLLVSHPAAFFLVSGYSESLFLAMLLGYLYWQHNSSGGHLALTVAHGVIMGATRIVGVAFAGFPVLASVINLLRKIAGSSSEDGLCGNEGMRSLGITAAPVVGALLLFVYTWFRFGVFDLYLVTGNVGWGIKPDYLAFFSLELFKFHSVSGDPHSLNRLMVPATFWSLLATGVAEVCLCFMRRGFSQAFMNFRLPAYGCVLAMFYLVVSSRACLQFQSMLRYQLVWFFPQMLCAGSLLQDSRLLSNRRVIIAFSAGMLIMVGLLLWVQLHLLALFVADQWVA